MGDSGSLLLGYMMTAFVFEFCELNSYKLVAEEYLCSAAPAVSICVLTVPLFDTLRVMVTRIKHHQSPFKPDRNHIHHLLLSTGLTHFQTTCVLLAASLLFIGIAILGRNWNMWLLVGTDFSLSMILTWILWRVVDKTKKQQ
jgi:UDP-N-acetylmuramyl pentapeptide phosphotransferase/UDP-N-acetylglucosamine-1-phosphate transferase